VKFGPEGLQLGPLPALASNPKLGSLLLLKFHLKFMAKFLSVTIIVGFYTPPWLFRLFLGENLPPNEEVMVLIQPMCLVGGINFFNI
jgi:hypothetical protein